MARDSTMSVLGIYNYCIDNTWNPLDIWEGFRVPDGVERYPLIRKIMLDTSDMECLYPEPETLKFGITAWTDTNFLQWERIWETCTYDYNPFENYDMTEEYERVPDLKYNTTRTPDLTTTRTPDLTSTRTPNLTSTRTPDLTQVSTNSGTDTSNSYVSAFSSEETGLVNNARQTAQLGTSNTITNTGTERTAETGTELTAETGTETTAETGTETSSRTETGTEKYVRTTKGDASVRSASQVIEEMRKERLWSFYQYIEDSFIDNFCNKCYSL